MLRQPSLLLCAVLGFAACEASKKGLNVDLDALGNAGGMGGMGGTPGSGGAGGVPAGTGGAHTDGGSTGGAAPDATSATGGARADAADGPVGLDMAAPPPDVAPPPPDVAIDLPPPPVCPAGSDGMACPAGHCCGGSCVDNKTVATCGTACTPCGAPPNARATCDGTKCGFACNDGFGDCDGNVANGCEVNLKTDVNHCGKCESAVCPTPPNSVASCVDGTCRSGCGPNHGDCTNAPGCETDLRTSAAHCGSCTTPCPSRPNTTPTCVNRMCQSPCNNGFDDCDGMTSNGCEANLRTSTQHCQMCGNACAVRAHANASCSDQGCRWECASGWGNCDGNLASNGCETNLTTSEAHCGGCNKPCVARPNSTVTCTAQGCVYTCVAGFDDCDKMPGNGCEIDLRSDKNHCGTCPNACPNGPTTPGECSGGQCRLACVLPKADCNKSAADDCETDLTNDVLNCGACHPNQTANPNDANNPLDPPACHGWEEKCVPNDDPNATRIGKCVLK